MTFYIVGWPLVEIFERTHVVGMLKLQLTEDCKSLQQTGRTAKECNRCLEHLFSVNFEHLYFFEHLKSPIVYNFSLFSRRNVIGNDPVITPVLEFSLLPK